MAIKLCVHVKTGEVLESSYSHADAIGYKRFRDYDDFSRALYWPDRGILYFRFCCKNWDNPTEDDKADAFRLADRALSILKKQKRVSKSVKVLYWQTGHGLTDYDVRL